MFVKYAYDKYYMNSKMVNVCPDTRVVLDVLKMLSAHVQKS